MRWVLLTLVPIAAGFALVLVAVYLLAGLIADLLE
jgi:hypothetical protein